MVIIFSFLHVTTRLSIRLCRSVRVLHVPDQKYRIPLNCVLRKSAYSIYANADEIEPPTPPSIFTAAYLHHHNAVFCIGKCAGDFRWFCRRFSPLDDPVKKNSLHPRGTKVVIYHLVGNFMLNSMQNVVSLATCAESL